MKKSFSAIVFSVALVSLVGCSKTATTEAKVVNVNGLAEKIQGVMKERGDNITVKAEELKKLTDPAGFSYVQLTYEKDGEQVAQYKVFTDGSKITEDFIDVASLSSMSKELEFETAKPVNIPTDNLTLVAGTKGAKTTIIEVTDFQCPYCKRASNYLKDKLADKKDVALYIVHLPLDMHPSAKTMAQVYEAGMLMGKNYVNDLFNADYDMQFNEELDKMQQKNKEKRITEDDVKPIIEKINKKIIDDYAKKSGDEKKFKELIESEMVKAKLENSQKIVEEIKAQSTPMIYVNGKLIAGFDQNRLDKILSEVK